MKTRVTVYISRADLLAFARQHSEPADAIPDDATIEVIAEMGYTLVDGVDDPIRVSYETDDGPIVVTR